MAEISAGAQPQPQFRDTGPAGPAAAAASAAATTAPARRKFATPPVKIACLACRSSRTRCDGANPCASCTAKHKECRYQPSRRGGPRIRKKPRPGDLKASTFPLSEPVVETVTPQIPLPVTNYIDPGAGLRYLNETFPDDSDILYDNLFMSGNVDVPQAVPQQAEPMVRTYRDPGAILNAYYIWIHPFFPILPPPEAPPVPDEVVPLLQDRPGDLDEPSSPLALAISALLALIPCAQDPSPLDQGSVLFRRKYAQFLAQSALECIENESEKPESAVEPPRALEDSDAEIDRTQFHPGVPLELETVIALGLLSVYEYGQRGNLKKMRSRSSTAHMAAMDLYLHLESDIEDGCTEARRRAWWMTYVAVSQSCIVGNMHPAFELLPSSLTVKQPTIHADPEAWPSFIKSQQAILRATEFVVDLNEAMKKQLDMTPIYHRMTELENFLNPLVADSEAWVLNCPTTQPVDNLEAVVAHSLRNMARIKLNSARIKVHRYCAFFDTPVFSGKHCDLKPVGDKIPPASEPQHWPSCCSYFGSSSSSSGSYAATSSPVSIQSTPTSDGGHSHKSPLALIFPFSSHESAKVCLGSAINISKAFESLPYPNPSAQLCEPPCYLGPGFTMIAPRTMPSFACCAMQCAYVMLMVYDRTQAMYPNAWNNDPGQLTKGLELLGRLRQGLLAILGTLENYGSAFEALGGMRDQIRDKAYSSMIFESGACC